MESSNTPKKDYGTSDDWKESWTKGHFPFHKQMVHDFLVKHISTMTNGKPSLKILFPLCGKDVSIKWLADQGHTVVGTEISPVALRDFFTEQNIDYTEEVIEHFTVFKSKDSKIRLYCGDMFLFSSIYEGKFDGIWDRGALVALLPHDRKKYSDVLKEVMAPDARYLLVTHQYDQSKMNGPPFSVPVDLIQEIFGGFTIMKLDGQEMISEFVKKSKGRDHQLDSMMEFIYLLEQDTKQADLNPQADRQLTGDDWNKKWEDRRIGFHQPFLNKTLEKHMIKLTKGRTELKIFVPLCGKSVDMKWLADQGHIVVGVEISSIAIREFFQEQELEYTEEKMDSYTVYKSKDNRIYLYCGDLFNFSSQYHGEFDAIWDRASLVAINPKEREKYVYLMQKLLSPDGKCLLAVLDYDASKYAGTPFSVPPATVFQLYEKTFSIQLLEQSDALQQTWKDRGLDRFTETTFILSPKVSTGL